jgi:hypothetical protein
MRFRDECWADIIDLLTMYPDARRRVMRILGEVNAATRRFLRLGLSSVGGKETMLSKIAFVAAAGVLVFGMACSSSTSSSSTSSTDTSEQVCQKFRDVAGGAFGESMSNDQIASGLDEVGTLAQTATGDIAKYRQQVAAEANVKSLVNGSPNKAQDGLSEACNAAYPI